MFGLEALPFGVRRFLVALFAFVSSSIEVFFLSWPVLVIAPVGASELNRA